MESLARLKVFRQAMYNNLCKVHDVTFGLTDVVIFTRKVYFLGNLFLCTVFRRKWSSVYKH